MNPQKSLASWSGTCDTICMTTTNLPSASRISGSSTVTIQFEDGTTSEINGKAAARAKFVVRAWNGEAHVIVGVRSSRMANWYGCPVVNIEITEV